MKIYILIITVLVLCFNLCMSGADNRGRKLFVEDTYIYSTNMKRVHHYPRYYSGNPILRADRPWELNAQGDPYAAPFSGGVWYDEVDKKFKMWYSAGGGKHLGLITCYAESEEGIFWKKPMLDVVSGTNIVDTTEHDCVSVLLDKFETDPAKRYKMFVVEFNNRESVSMRLKYSADGIHWEKPVALSGEIYDRSGVYFDPFRGVYVLSLKTLNGIYRRSRNYLAEKDPELLVSLAHRTFDFTSDKFIRYWFKAEENDPRHPDFPEIRPQIYNHEAMPYEDILLGYFTVWQGPENNVCDQLRTQKRNEVLIGWSLNGRDWIRDSIPFLPVSPIKEAWNAGNVQSTNGNPLIVGDSLYFYVSGRFNNPEWESNFSTGLAMLRRDGFVSLHTGIEEGFLITAPVKLNDKHLFVNAEVEKDLRVAVLDEQGREIEGFSLRECNVIRNKNGTKLPITWKKKSNLSSLEGQKIQLKFKLSKGDLYAFWFSGQESGESGGYTAGGGPGLHDSGKDIIKID